VSRFVLQRVSSPADALRFGCDCDAAASARELLALDRELPFPAAQHGAMGSVAPLAIHGRWQVRSSAQHVSKKGRQHSQRRAEYFPRRQRRFTTLLARTRLVSDRIESTDSVAACWYRYGSRLL